MNRLRKAESTAPDREVQGRDGVKSHVPLVSLCSTNFNTQPITMRSVESILARIGKVDWEMVVVDNFSTDGSYETLRSLSDSFPLFLERYHCTRGAGRQRAFEHSRGEYVVTFDLDTIYNDNWAKLLRWVLANRIDFGLSAAYSQFYPRAALLRVGGWRDLQYWEDVDLWTRLAGRGLYKTYPVICGENLKRVAGRNRIEKVTRLYSRCRDKVATTPHIPFSLYWQGYLAFITTKQRIRSWYYLGVFLPAYVVGKRKRSRLQRGGHDSAVLLDPGLVIDLSFVPREELAPVVSPYDTLDGCRSSLGRGDLGFLPGTYD